MPLRIKILGAGSIGNHLANAARTLGWAVDLCDVDPAALERARGTIYPARYGTWDDAIRLFDAAAAPKGGYDIVMVGTPPDSHVPLAIEAIRERPRAVLVEKPLCGPDLADAARMVDLAEEAGVALFVGYDHVVGKAARKVEDLIGAGAVGRIATMDVEFREHWGGILAAHPWLDGPWSSYLAFWRRGGGALGEHSHAANLWQHFAHATGAGRVTEVSAAVEYVRDGRVDYDRLAFLTLRTERGLTGRVVQDVITRPVRKASYLQGEGGFIEWHCGYRPGVDAVFHGTDRARPEEHLIAKTRPDDFIEELHHLESALKRAPTESPLHVSRGLDTMLVVAAAHLSAAEKRTVAIDHSAGCTPAALRIV